MADTVLDFVPIAGGVKDIYKGINEGNGWMVALGAGSIVLDVFTLGGSSLVKGGIKTGIKVGARSVASSAAKTGTNVVYQGIDAAGKVKYVGITSRAPGVRFSEHRIAVSTGKELLRYEVIEGATGLSRTGARVWEQSLINQYGLGKNGGQLLNQINSIAPKNWWQYGIK